MCGSMRASVTGFDHGVSTADILTFLCNPVAVEVGSGAETGPQPGPFPAGDGNHRGFPFVMRENDPIKGAQKHRFQ